MMIPRSFRLALAGTCLLALPAEAQFQDGDLLVSFYGFSEAASIVHYRPSGEVVAEVSGRENEHFSGVTVLSGDRWFTARRDYNGVNIFDSGGTGIATFDTPEITPSSIDTDVLSDGTLVIGDLGGEIELYTELGVHLRTIADDGMTKPLGLHVDEWDHIWVADSGTVDTDEGVILKFDRDGTLLSSFLTDFELGDLFVASDGTIWCSDRVNCIVKHLDPTGLLLSSFSTAVPAWLYGIGMAPDGTIYCIGTSSNHVYHYDQAGVLLGSFTVEGDWPTHLTIAHRVGPGDSFCFGDPGSGIPCPCANDNDGSVPGSGCDNGVFASGAQLTGSGVARISADSLVLSTTHLEPDNGGLYLQADNDLSPGILWGDGLRCAGGNLRRLQVRFSDASGTSATTIRISTRAGNVNAGDRKYYQCWYRTTVNPPCGPGASDFNSSNGYAVTWLP